MYVSKEVPASAPNLNTMNDSEGIQRGEVPVQPEWGATLKRILAGVVVVAGAGAAIFPPHTVAHQVCVAILGLGGLGITSTGNQKR